MIAGGEKNKWDYPLKVKIDLVYSHILNNYELKDSFSDWEILIRKHWIINENIWLHYIFWGRFNDGFKV